MQRHDYLCTVIVSVQDESSKAARGKARKFLNKLLKEPIDEKARNEEKSIDIRGIAVNLMEHLT